MKYIIIGAVAGGASAAARLRRMDEQAEIVVFEKGDYISYANCGLPYYIGNVINDRNALFVTNAISFKQRFAIDVRIQTVITGIDPIAKTVTAMDLKSGNVYTETYDKLLLAPGAEPIRPPLPGITLPGIVTLRNVMDTDSIKALVQQKQVKRVVVVGGGFIGLEMAENLHHIGLEVTVIEMGNQVLAPLDYPLAAMVQQHIRTKGVDLQLQTAVTSFEKKGEQLLINLNNGKQLTADLVVLSIGVRPDISLAQHAGLTIGSAKGIWVNSFMQTSNESIYAVGDAIEFTNPITGVSMNTYLAGPANKQGRIAADNMVLGNHKKYNGAVNTAIVKVFDLTVAATGMPAKQLANLQIAHQVSTSHHSSHAGYYPGSQPLSIQLVFDPEQGRLYGAQIVGYDGVDKRIDVLSSMVQHNETIDDLTAYEQAYAPPFSSAKDPINMSGFVAENIMTDRLRVFYWDQVAALDENTQLVDVRTAEEFASGAIANAINIPLDELRNRMNELPTNKRIAIYCQAGLRGYIGQRILRQRGFEQVMNLSGGYQLYKSCMQEQGLLNE